MVPGEEGWSLINSMVNQEIIESRTFSIDVAHLGSEDDHGSIIFGGVDSKKFRGQLEKLPMIKYDDDGDDEEEEGKEPESPK